jgi:hypothetical protein
MYDVYTMERPGHPRLAVTLTAALLLGTVAFAWMIVLQKQRAAYAALLEPQRVGSWPLSIRPPAGWKAVPLKDAPPTIGLVLAEPGRRGRTLAVVRGPMLESALPPAYAAGAVEDAVLWLSGAEAAKRLSAEPAPFGPIPGIQVEWLAGHRRRPMEQVLGCIGVAPQGQVYALLLKCPGRGDRNDERFLRNVASTAEFPGVSLTDDVSAAARQCGLEFDTPRDVMAFAAADGPVKRLQLISDPDAGKPWTLELTTVPLAPGRTPQAVLEDVIRNLVQDPQHSAQIETTRFKDREAYHVRLTGEDGPWEGELWAVAPDPQGLVLLIGHDEDADSGLTQRCRSIAESVRFAEGAERLDVKAGVRRGEELLARIRKDHVDDWFDEWSGEDLLYLIDRAGETEGYYRLGYARFTEDRKAFWRVESEIRRVLPGGHSLTYKREAQVDPEGIGYQLVEVRRATTTEGRALRRRTEPFQYQESRASGGKTVRKILRIDKEEYDKSFSAGNGFACDPVLGIAFWLAATDSQRRPVVVMSSDRFDAASTAQIIYPLGARPVPGGDPQKTAPAVVVQGDSNTSAYMVYFDEYGKMICVDFGDGTAFHRCTEKELRERFSLVPGRSLSPMLIR